MAKKVLFIGHIYEQSGWGNASRNYLTALNRSGLDIVARGIRPNKNGPVITLNSELQQLTEKEIEGSKICIQHLLPHLMDRGDFEKNIALFVTETQDWWQSGWHRHLNHFDEVWVPNCGLYKSATTNQLTQPIHVVPHACNIEQYSQVNKPLDIPETRGNFVFYWIGELNRRKRITALVQSFYLEFTKNEPVSLVLKVNKPGLTPNAIATEISRITDEIKYSHKLYGQNDQYPHIVIVPGYVENIHEVHATGHCYVNASFGEAWEQSAFDAMAYDKWVISSNEGGPKDFLNLYNKGHLINGTYGPVFGMNETFGFLNTARETWFHADINHMRKAMRHVYRLQSRNSKNEGNGLEQAQRFSYENIGKKMKDLLCT